MIDEVMADVGTKTELEAVAVEVFRGGSVFTSWF